MDRWTTDLKTLREIRDFCEKNPEYKKFLDLPLSVQVTEEMIDNRDNWDDRPEVRFSEDHQQLILVGNSSENK